MVAPPAPQRITLDTAVRKYLDAMEASVTVAALSAKTVDNYRRDLAGLVHAVGGTVIVDDITGEDVDRAVLAFGKSPDARMNHPETKAGPGRSAASQKRFLQSVSKFFSHAARHQWVQVSPMAWVTLKPRVRGGLRTARTSLTAEQAQALLTHGAEPVKEGSRSHERNAERDALILALMLVTGPRVSEVVAANTNDFSTNAGVVYWRINGKGGHVRKIPLSPWLVERKDAYVAARPSPPANTGTDQARADAARALFRSGRGMRLGSRDVQRMLERAHIRVLHADPEHAREITPHALRHTAATLMLSNGWDVKVVAQMLGHASISTTGTYLDALPGELAEAVARSPLTPQSGSSR